MRNITPNPLKEYYIAYFDILGYKQFFETSPEKVPELLNLIHNAIQQTNGIIGIANNSPLLHEHGKIEIKTKVFSDNVLLCMEKLDGDLEPFRMITFLEIVAGIQRGFVLDYGLFVRGGITIGELSFNDDYVFGQGIIDAVGMEAAALYPRIIVNEKLFKEILDFNPSQESFSKASSILNKKLNNESVEQYDEDWFNAFNRFCVLKLALANIVFLWNDKAWCLCYLHKIDPNSIFGTDITSAMKNMVAEKSPYDFGLINLPTATVDDLLKKHKEIVEEKLIQYGSNDKLPDGAVKEAEEREKTLRKYIWVMAYHNQFCVSHQKDEYFINTICNCDKRFMKMIIFVNQGKSETQQSMSPKDESL